MVPTPLQIVLMITACAEAVSSACQLAITPAGQELIKQGISDRAKWDAFWLPIGGWTKDLFTGKLFQVEPKP